MTQPISTDPDLDTNGQRNRWRQVSDAIKQLQMKLNRAVVYGATSAPGGGTIIASGTTTGTLSVSGSTSFGGGISTTSISCTTLTATSSGTAVNISNGNAFVAGGISTGQNAMHFFTGTFDPGSAAAEGDVWFDG